MRLDKFLADAGIGTRSEVKKIIKSGRISVNLATVKTADIHVDPSADIISLDGSPVAYEENTYLLFHKPSGCVTAKSDDRLPTVMDCFPENMRDKLSPVGRLDKDTEGLLIITDDGALNHRLTSPAHHVKKTYFARLDAPVPASAVELFKSGVDIGDKTLTRPAELTVLPEGCEAELTISEGRFHQVKRMFEAVGCRVIYLKRLSMGTLTLGDLKCGEYRKLLPEEVEKLKNYK
jgi:16S rRNA pseudouridine516 synthase